MTKPVNVVMGYARFEGKLLSVSDLAAMGVKRISFGSALSRVALGAFLRAAQEIREHGTFSLADQAIPMATVKDLVAPRS